MKGCEDDVYVQQPEVKEGAEYESDEEEKFHIEETLPLGRYGEADLKYVEKGNDYTTVGGVSYIKDYVKFDTRSLNMVDVKDIDIVFVGNYNSVLALPFICCHPDFKGKVLITEPLHQVGKFLCSELLEMWAQNQNFSQAHKHKFGHGKTDDEKSMKDEYLKESELNDFFEYLKLELWCDIYTSEDIEKTFDEMCSVLHYNQEFESCHPLKITPLSSGHHLGSCNWLIDHKVFNKKIGILQQSCLKSEIRYPLRMNMTALKDWDVLFIGSIVNEHYFPPKSGDDTYSISEALKQLNDYINQHR
jgi:hypothetical protein